MLTERFLEEQRVARLATVDAQGRPHIVPIVFVYADEVLYTPIDLKPKVTQPERLQRVRNIRSHPDVQVLVDHYDEDWRQLGYVQLRGTAEIIQSGSEYSQAMQLLEAKYQQYRELPLEGRPIIKVSVERMVSWAAGDSPTTETRNG